MSLSGTVSDMIRAKPVRTAVLATGLLAIEDNQRYIPVAFIISSSIVPEDRPTHYRLRRHHLSTFHLLTDHSTNDDPCPHGQSPRRFAYDAGQHPIEAVLKIPARVLPRYVPLSKRCCSPSHWLPHDTTAHHCCRFVETAHRSVELSSPIRIFVE